MNYYDPRQQQGYPMYNEVPPYQATPYFNNPGFQPGMWGQPTYRPQNNSSLTKEEKATLAQNDKKFSLQVDETEVYRAMCNHKDNGQDMVRPFNDDSGRVYCTLCHESWLADKSTNYTPEQIQNCVDILINMMQISKWLGDLPINITREYYAMIPLLKKFPEIYKMAMANFNKYCNMAGYTNADESSAYNKYNSLMNNGGVAAFYQPNPFTNYTNQFQNYGYAPGVPGYAQPAPNYGGYQQTGQPPYNQQAPMNNPMQAPMYNPNPNYNGQQGYPDPYAQQQQQVAPSQGMPSMYTQQPNGQYSFNANPQAMPQQQPQQQPVQNQTTSPDGTVTKQDSVKI